MFKADAFSARLIDSWIAVYRQLETLRFPSYYVWGGDNCALVMILGGYNPYSMTMSEDKVEKYFPRIFAEHIEVVKDLQYNEFLLQKAWQNDVGLIPQSMFNSFETFANSHLILHCAGSWKCKQLLPLKLPTSTCSKTNLLIRQPDPTPNLISDPFLKSFCIFHSFEIKK